MISSITPSAALSNSGWYHSFRFGNVTIKDTRTSLEFQMWAAQDIPLDLSHKSVLDIGAADGFYSFLCESRGARKVIAVDYDNYAGFNIAKKILNSNVKHLKMNLYDLDNLNESFDIVILFGVYYHLDNPVLGLQKIYPKVNETLYLAGHIIDSESPLMCLYDEYELHPHDPTNWWVASPACILKMGKRVGFKKCELIDTLPEPNIYQKTDKSLEKVYGLGLFKFSK